MAPIAVCVLALLLVSAHSQTTQAVAWYPWWCMRTAANESTGEVWAELALCRWKQEFHIDAPNASDQKIRSGEGQCLVGGSEGDGQCFFDRCDEGQPLQKWKFIPTGVTSETLATPDGADSVSGQIVLASADANTNRRRRNYSGTLGMLWARRRRTRRPKMCLKSNSLVEGQRITTVPCDNWSPDYTTWTYAPPPPSNKVLLVMPARHAAGEEACVQMIGDGYSVQIGDCGDEDLVLNWWVRDGELIRSASVSWERDDSSGSGGCLKSGITYVGFGGCEQNDENSWSLGKDGSLKLTTSPDEGCFTYVSSPRTSAFEMKPCTGDGNQTFTFLSDAPTTDAVQVA